MKNKTILSIALIAVCGLIALSLLKQKPASEHESIGEKRGGKSEASKMKSGQTVGHDGGKPAPIIASVRESNADIAARIPEAEKNDLTPVALSDEVPESLQKFREWSTQKQLEHVTRMMNNPQIDTATLEFFRAALHDPELDLHVRNNMANALIAQENKNPLLYKDFIQMIHDENQPERWRAYSIQFLTETRTFAGNRQAIDNELSDIALGEGLQASQAQMMLSTLENRGELKLSDSFNELQAASLKNENSDTNARITALSLLGRRKAVKHREIIREYASKECPERRVAIAALGQIAHPDDKPLIEQALKNGDALTQKAAQAALKNFE